MRQRHGMTGTRIYKLWGHMKERCYNKNSTNYDRYGGRGIQVCEEWKNDFMSFYNWAMENGYQENLTLDREDNDGNYEPSNCRWVTFKEQENNRGGFNINVTYQGRTQTLMQWAEETGIPFPTLRYRIVDSKWPVEDALTIGVGAIKKHPLASPHKFSKNPMTEEQRKKDLERRKQRYRSLPGKMSREEYLNRMNSEKTKNIQKIQEELQRSPGLSTRKMAERVGLSRSYVQRVYQQLRREQP